MSESFDKAQDRIYFLGLSVFPGIGPKRFEDLLQKFGTARFAWEASEEALREVLGNILSAKFVAFRTQFSIENYLELLKKNSVGFITRADKDYPKKLLDLSDPPFLLYFRGDKSLLSAKNIIGIVGTRRITSYGSEITASFTRDLVYQGFVTVSGLALGVDGLVHRETIESEGKTIAVLGCGVDCCYPSTNQSIYDGILQNGGLIISEYPLSAKPSKGSFPSRNRIIAALSDGLLVTEGAEDSGSLITANTALDLGRLVFAIPGPVTSDLSRGPLKLIRKGARLVTNAGEILQELGIKNHESGSKKKVIKGDTKEEQKIIDLLQNESMHIDDIVRKTGFDISKIGVLLSFMEIKGLLIFSDNTYRIA